MLYVLIEAERVRTQKLQKEDGLRTLESGNLSEDRAWEAERSDGEVLGQHSSKEPPMSSQPQTRDSDWFTLSPREILAWAKASPDPRIAVDQQSPLEKKLLNLGGVHSTAARQLITQKYQEEYEALCREQALSLDYWLAKAESYYNKRIVDMMKEQDTGHEKKLEGRMTQNLEKLKRYYLVPDRELKHIERHIHRVGQVRELKNKAGRHLPRPSETKFPRILPEERGVLGTQRRKQVSEREQIQIKDHQQRMLQGREVLEQRLQEGVLRQGRSQRPTRDRCARAEKETKEFESVTVYPLFQPCSQSRIKVNILMEKNREEAITIIKPHQRKFLTMPPFLRSQIGKIKD